MSSRQTGGQRERDNRRKNKKCNKRYINTNTEANANLKRKLWSVIRLGRRDGQKPKKRLVGEGGNRKGKLGESLALVAGVAKGWLGWAGTRVGKGLIFPTPHVWGGGTNERGGIVH